MVELMTVVAIIAILAAISIPAYVNYITGTKLQALWKLGEPAKLYVESQFYKNALNVDELTINSTEREFTTSPDTDLAKCITIQSGIISVVGNPDSFYGNTFWIAWIPSVSSGTLQWSCSYNEGAQQYLESALKNCTIGSEQYSDDTGCT